MMEQQANIMVNKIITLVAVITLLPIFCFGQGITWDHREDRSKVLLHYPADTGHINDTWIEEACGAHLTSPDGITQVSGRSEFYTAPYTAEARYAVRLDSTVLYNKGDFIYTGDSLSVYFALRMWDDQENTTARLISLVDTAGDVGDHNGLSIWLHNNRLQVSSNGKLCSGTSKFLQRKVWLVEVHINQRGATIVLDGDTLHHNREFVPYNFNINGVVIGADYDYANYTDYVRDVNLGDIVVTEGPVDWMREEFNKKYHLYPDISYESLTSISDSHPVKLLLDMTKLDGGRFLFLNSGRHTQSNYYYGLWDTIFTSDLVGLEWNFTPGVTSFPTTSEDPRARSVHFNGEWLPYANGSSSYYFSYPVDGASVGNATSFTFLNEWGMAFADNNNQSQIWPNGIYWYEDPDQAWLPNYTHGNNTSKNASPYQGQDFFDFPYDSLRVSGYVGRYYDSDNTELRIFHNKATGPLVMNGVDIFNNSFTSGFWWVRSIPNNLFFPFRWSKLVGFDGQMKWRESSYLMHNWDRIDFTNQVDKPVSESFIHEYESSSDYLTVKASTDTLSVWQDKMGRIDIVDTTVVGYTNKVIGVATVDTINWSVECREEKSFYIPFDSCWQYKNVNVYIVMEDLSNGSDSNWIGLIHTNTAQETNQALLRWHHFTGGIAYQLGSYTNGTSTTGEEYFKSAHLNYYDYEYWPRWNLDGATGNKYAITIDDDRFKGDAKVTFDSMANRKQIVMLEGVNTAGWSGISMSYVAGNVTNGNFDIKHVIVTHGEENPNRVFSYLQKKYDWWLDDRYEPGLLDPNAEAQFVSYDVSELMDTSVYQTQVWMDFEDTYRDYQANGADVRWTFDRVTGTAIRREVGGSSYFDIRNDYNLNGESEYYLKYNTSTNSWANFNEDDMGIDSSFTLFMTVETTDNVAENFTGFMSMETDNNSTGPWWFTGGAGQDYISFRYKNSTKWNWATAEDTVSVIGWSHNKNGDFRGRRFLAGKTSNTWVNKNGNTSINADIDYDPNAYDWAITGDYRLSSGLAEVNYIDKIVWFNGAMDGATLERVTKFYPKLRDDRYPAVRAVNIPDDLDANVIGRWESKYGRRQDNDNATNSNLVRWYYNLETGASVDLTQVTQADRPPAFRKGGIDFGGTGKHMDYADFLDEGSGVGDFSVFLIVSPDDTTNTHSWINYSSGSTTGGNDVFVDLSTLKRVGVNRFTPSSNLRDEASVDGMSIGIEFERKDTILMGITADENGKSYLWVNGDKFDLLQPDGTWRGADEFRTFGMERYGNNPSEGIGIAQYWFNKALNDDEVRRLTDSIISVYPGIQRKKRMDISYNPFIVIDGSLKAQTTDGVSSAYDVSLRQESQHHAQQSIASSKPDYGTLGSKYVDFNSNQWMELSANPFSTIADSVITISQVVTYHGDDDQAYTRWNVLCDGDNYYFRIVFAEEPNTDYFRVEWYTTDNHPVDGGDQIVGRNFVKGEPVLITVRASETRGIDLWVNGFHSGHFDIDSPGWDGIAGSAFHGFNRKRNSDNYHGLVDLYAYVLWDDFLTEDQIKVAERELVYQLKLPDLDTTLMDEQEFSFEIRDSVDNNLAVGWSMTSPFITTTGGTYPYTGQAWTDWTFYSELTEWEENDPIANLTFSGTGSDIWTYGGRRQRYVPLFNSNDGYTMNGTWDFPDTTTIVFRFRRKANANLYAISQYTSPTQTTSLYVDSNNNVNFICDDVQWDTGIDIERDSVFYMAWTLGGNQMHLDVIKMVKAIEGASPGRVNPQDWGSASRTFASSSPTIDRLIINGYDSGTGNPSNANFTPMEYVLTFEGRLSHEELKFLARNIESTKRLLKGSRRPEDEN
jgi:hypothetical protein